jgi:hypothetical protein
MIQLNVNVGRPDGQPAVEPVITLYVLDAHLNECPMEPRIRGQANFYAGDIPFAQAVKRDGPFMIYGSATAKGCNTALIVGAGGQPIMWDGTATIDIPVLLSFKSPFQPATRYWNGVNMCGDHYDGLPAVPGGSPDSSLFLSWFYDRYDQQWRSNFRTRNQALGRTHWLLSWPDSRAMGATPQSFAETCLELVTTGFSPCVMLTSKDYDRWPGSPYISDDNAHAIIADLEHSGIYEALVGIVPMFSEGWELADWWQPWQLQWLIDAVAPQVLRQAGTMNYVHLGAGRGSWQPNGKFFADFWNVNMGKLHGLLHEKLPAQTRNQYQFDSGGLYDILIRFAGGFNCSPDSGFGHPWDLVALEITANFQFETSPPMTRPMTTEEGDTWGDTAITTPAVNGPFGPVHVMGSGNGYTR